MSDGPQHLPNGNDVEIFQTDPADKFDAPTGKHVTAEKMSRYLLQLAKGRRIRPNQLIGSNTVELMPNSIVKVDGEKK